MPAASQTGSAAQRDAALELFEQGKGFAEIAAELGVNRGTVYRWCKAATDDAPRDEAPPLPERLPTRPIDSPSWLAFVDLLCWARALPGATDGSALARACDVAPETFGEWLELGLRDWRAGDDTPAAELARRWLTARGESLDKVFAALHAGLKGNGSIAAAAAALLERLLPGEYSGQPTVVTGGRRSDPIADILDAALNDHELP